MKGASAQSALPVATLTGHIRDLLESNFRGLWVTGELREVKPHHTGHVYMALRDGEARLDAVVWKGTVATMRWRPAEGTLVAAYGRLSLYAPHGAYRFIIERLEPVGAGALDAALQALYIDIVTSTVAFLPLLLHWAAVWLPTPHRRPMHN